jgi:hypothetical protein
MVKSWSAQLVVIESFDTAVPVDPGVLLEAGNWRILPATFNINVNMKYELEWHFRYFNF